MRSAYHILPVIKALFASLNGRAEVKSVALVCRGMSEAGRRAVCCLLVISMLASSTPAAARILSTVASEWQTDLVFWSRANDWPASWYRALTGQNRQRAKRQETQEERNTTIARIEIQPVKKFVEVGEELLLSAIAYDSQDVPVGGVSFEWRSDYSRRDQREGIFPHGAFVASVPGHYEITATAGGFLASIRINVLPRQAGNLPLITRRVSSDSIDQPSAKPPKGTQRAHAAPVYQAPFIDGDPAGWNSTNKPAAFIPQNERGETPGRTTVAANSNNFRIQTPVITLQGRGLDLDLNLIYNSRVWNKSNNANNQIMFNPDRDQISPGWSLSLPRIINMVDAGAFIIDADGTRHKFVGQLTINPNNGDRYFSANTTDGSFIEYGVVTKGIGTGTVDTYAVARYPDGKTVGFNGATSIANSSNIYVLYARRVKDSNGNFLWCNFSSGKISNIVDTLGRVITFHYDSNQLLTAVTAAGLKDDNGNVTTRTMVRLHYRQLTLDATFQGLTAVVTTTTPWVLDAIYYPATRTGLWFGETDSYSSYGMIKKVREQKEMTFSDAPLTQQGTFTAGTTTRELDYDYPAGPSNLADAPAFDTVTETWAGSTSGTAETHYDIEEANGTRKVTTTLPDLTKSVEYSYIRPGQYDDGLVYKVESVEGNTVLRTVATTWEPGIGSTARIKKKEFTDERNQTSYQTYAYGDGTGLFHFNQIQEIKEFDFSNNLVRRTAWTYSTSNLTFNYLYSEIPSGEVPGFMPYLIKSIDIYAGDGTRLARSEYNYDNYHDSNWSPNGVPYPGTLQDAPGVTSYSVYFDPYWFYWFYTFGGGRARGNITSVVSYKNAANLTGAITTEMTYDKTGNLRTVTTNGKQHKIDFTLATQYAYPTTETNGAADSNSSIRITETATYDFNTGFQLTATDANSRPTQNSYYLDSWRLKKTTAATGANILHEYDDIASTATHTTKGADDAIAEQSILKADGRGQTIRVEALAPGNVWDVLELQYDDFGRTTKESLPYRAGGTPVWRETFYDALGRVTRKVGPDQSETKIFYNETARPTSASTTVGQTARTVDAWGRERWALLDALGRTIEVVEPNPTGDGSVLASGSLQTKYTYDALGNITQIDQGNQQRRFRYDSLRRLTHQKLAEADATLNDLGQYVTAGNQWSSVFAYDDRSNLLWKVDARGVKTNLTFNNDPLDRLQSITYDTSGAGAGQTIHAAANITYQYMSTGDLTRLLSVTTSGISTETYDYDTEGRLKQKLLVLSSRTSYPALTEYIYDSLDRTSDVRYPVQYGLTGNPRKLVHHEYDVASRLNGLKVDGTDYASQIVYNPASQKTSMKVGTGTNQVTETYDYDSSTSLLTRQRVQRTGATMLDLNYEYLRQGTTTGRTGQLTKIVNNLNNNKNRSYTYDALGRLSEAKGGSTSTPLWTQTYSYDRFGNRTGTSSSGFSAWNRGFPSRKEWEEAQIAKASPPQDHETSVTQPGDSSVARELFDISKQDSEPEAITPPADTSAETKPLSRAKSHHATRATTEPVAPPAPPVPSFTDDPLNNPPDKTLIKAVHITELRDAINALRGLLAMAPYAWAEPVASGNYVKASHISEMRTALDQALGPPAGGYSAGLAQNLTVMATHIQELRDRVKTAWGSLSQIPRDGFNSMSYHQSNNRISAIGFEYDVAGNQTRVLRTDGAVQFYEYDAANRLVKVKNLGGTVIASYTYGEGNKRLIAQDGDENSNERTYYIWTAGVVMTEYTETASAATTPRWSRNYIFFGGRLLATQDINGTGELVQYHHPDRTGTRIVSRSDGTWDEQVSLPYGVAITAESFGTPNKRRFTSYDRSSNTQLDYAVNRSYDSGQGRFTQVDPIGMEAFTLINPQTLNLYAYCANDPINCVDPSGTDGIFSGILGGIIGGLFGGGRETGGGLLGGLLGGLFGFGLGVFGTIFGIGGSNFPFFGWPFAGFPQAPRRNQPQAGPGLTTITVSGTPQGSSGLQIPTDRNDRAVLEVLLGEASTPGERGWDSDSFGVMAYSNPTRTVTEDDVYGEMSYMVAVIDHRLKNWPRTHGYTYTSWYDVVSDGSQFEGWGNGQNILKNIENGTAEAHQIERARIAINAIRDFHAAPFETRFAYWKGIRQYRWVTPKKGKPYKRYFITKKGNAWRIALTDFHETNDRYK